MHVVLSQPAEMDFKTFLDLVLALENREHVESLRVGVWLPQCISPALHSL